MLFFYLPELSIETRVADFVPATATVINVALAFTFFVTVQHCRTNPLTFAKNAFGDLFSSTKPKQILVQVSRTPTIKAPPTPTVEYRHQSESTSNILYAVALCAVFFLIGAIVIVLRKKSTANISSPSLSVNPRFHIGSAGQASDNGSSFLDGDISEHFGSGSSNLTAALIDDNSDKNAPGFLEKVKTFFILFFILTSFTHGGRITQKIRSLAIRDDFTSSSNNATATYMLYFHQASELVTTKAAAHFDDDFPATFTGGDFLVSEIVETLTFNILYSSTPSSTVPAPSILSSHSSGSNEKNDSISLLPPPSMTSNLTPAYPNGLSLVMTTPSPTTTSSSSSKATLDLAFEYIKKFILIFFFILIPILSFPAYIDYVQFSKTISADQQESPVTKFTVMSMSTRIVLHNTAQVLED